MTKTYWNRVVPHNINHALRLCKQHGIEKNQMSVERLADALMATADTLYKWIGNARLPVNAIVAYEQACGINFITQYLAHSQGFLLVPVPSGKRAEHKDLAELQLFMTEVSALIIKCHNGSCNAQTAIDGISTLMKDLAWQQNNIGKINTPQPELFGELHEH